MKKNRKETPGYTLTLIVILLLVIFTSLYIDWYFNKKQIERENRELQEMADYHRSQGRTINLY